MQAPLLLLPSCGIPELDIVDKDIVGPRESKVVGPGPPTHTAGPPGCAVALDGTRPLESDPIKVLKLQKGVSLGLGLVCQDAVQLRHRKPAEGEEAQGSLSALEGLSAGVLLHTVLLLCSW